LALVAFACQGGGAQRACDHREDPMRFANLIGAAVLAAAFLMTIVGASAFEESKYPDLKGQWRRAGGAGLLAGGAGGFRYDESKPPSNDLSLGEQPPLTPEYQAIWEANLDDMGKGGQGIDPTYSCLNPGMPRVMLGYSRMEFVVTPETTYIPMTRDHDFMRHIYTDGRDFPANMAQEPRFLGYSIGKWLDTDNDGRYDTLEVETRGLKGPRVYDATGIPLHSDNETVIYERIYLDKADANLLHDDITTIDHALTRPWVVSQAFRRVTSDKPLWFDHQVCAEYNAHVGIGKEVYFLSGDGLLMPAVKDQPPPDLRYFKKYGQ
jgi:hypothetical protein